MGLSDGQVKYANKRFFKIIYCDVTISAVRVSMVLFFQQQHEFYCSRKRKKKKKSKLAKTNI